MTRPSPRRPRLSRPASYAVAAAAGAAALLAGGLVAGHSGGPDRSQVAAAKCSLPVIEKLGGDSRTLGVHPQAVDVAALGDGRYRVRGSVADQTSGRSYTYVCEVVPDPSDRLRGFRVTRLDVEPA